MEDHHVNLLAVDIDAKLALNDYTAAVVAADMDAGRAGLNKLKETTSADFFNNDEGSSSCWPFKKKKKKTLEYRGSFAQTW